VSTSKRIRHAPILFKRRYVIRFNRCRRLKRNVGFFDILLCRGISRETGQVLHGISPPNASSLPRVTEHMGLCDAGFYYCQSHFYGFHIGTYRALFSRRPTTLLSAHSIKFLSNTLPYKSSHLDFIPSKWPPSRASFVSKPPTAMKSTSLIWEPKQSSLHILDRN
jgi:hypothetical protein